MVCVCVYQYSNEQTAVSLVASRWNLLILVVHVVESRTNLPGRAGGTRPLYTDSRLRSAWPACQARTDTQRHPRSRHHPLIKVEKVKIKSKSRPNSPLARVHHTALQPPPAARLAPTPRTVRSRQASSYRTVPKHRYRSTAPIVLPTGTAHTHRCDARVTEALAVEVT